MSHQNPLKHYQNALKHLATPGQIGQSMSFYTRLDQYQQLIQTKLNTGINEAKTILASLFNEYVQPCELEQMTKPYLSLVKQKRKALNETDPQRLPQFIIQLEQQLADKTRHDDQGDFHALWVAFFIAYPEMLDQNDFRKQEYAILATCHTQAVIEKDSVGQVYLNLYPDAAFSGKFYLTFKNVYQAIKTYLANENDNIEQLQAWLTQTLDQAFPASANKNFLKLLSTLSEQASQQTVNRILKDWLGITNDHGQIRLIEDVWCLVAKKIDLNSQAKLSQVNQFFHQSSKLSNEKWLGKLEHDFAIPREIADIADDKKTLYQRMKLLVQGRGYDKTESQIIYKQINVEVNTILEQGLSDYTSLAWLLLTSEKQVKQKRYLQHINQLNYADKMFLLQKAISVANTPLAIHLHQQIELNEKCLEIYQGQQFQSSLSCLVILSRDIELVKYFINNHRLINDGKSNYLEYALLSGSIEVFKYLSSLGYTLGSSSYCVGSCDLLRHCKKEGIWVDIPRIIQFNDLTLFKAALETKNRKLDYFQEGKLLDYTFSHANVNVFNHIKKSYFKKLSDSDYSESRLESMAKTNNWQMCCAVLDDILNQETDNEITHISTVLESYQTIYESAFKARNYMTIHKIEHFYNEKIYPTLLNISEIYADRISHTDYKTRLQYLENPTRAGLPVHIVAKSIFFSAHQFFGLQQLCLSGKFFMKLLKAFTDEDFDQNDNFQRTIQSIVLVTQDVELFEYCKKRWPAAYNINCFQAKTSDIYIHLHTCKSLSFQSKFSFLKHLIENGCIPNQNQLDKFIVYYEDDAEASEYLLQFDSNQEDNQFNFEEYSFNL